MTKFKCASCGGIYVDETEDGMQYFHTCPTSVKDTDRRDENTKSTAARDAKTIKAAGKGTTPQ